MFFFDAILAPFPSASYRQFGNSAHALFGSDSLIAGMNEAGMKGAPLRY